MNVLEATELANGVPGVARQRGPNIMVGLTQPGKRCLLSSISLVASDCRLQKSKSIRLQQFLMPGTLTLATNTSTPAQGGSLSASFLEHAIRIFRPRVIVLIVPPITPVYPDKYATVFENSDVMQGEVCYALWVGQYDGGGGGGVR